MRQLIIIPFLFLLTGCGLTGGEILVGAAGVAAGSKMQQEGIDPIPPKGKRTAEGYANQARDNIKKTADKVKGWWLTPLPSETPLPVQASYCYKAQTDVLCYRQPVPGWEHRLAGYQGTNAEPPPPAVMQLMPSQNIDSSKLASNRVAAAQPVFVELPPDTKEAPKDANQQSSVANDTSHETLPDPALSPQL